MARFTIKSKNGLLSRFVGSPVYHGAHLKPAYLEFREIASPTPISWQVGDYVDYTRTGYRYKLYSIPYPTKQAVAEAAGDSFVYRDVQFFAPTKDLEIAPFKDLVISDNTIHFTTLASVSTYEDVFGIARRIQANLDSFYGDGEWVIRVYDTSDPELRSVLLQTKEFTLSDGSCLDALSQIYSLWHGIGWVYSVENGVNTITIGRPNEQDASNTTSVFAYGIGNGLTVIKKEQSGKNDLATRLYAYGSTRNLIARYYNNLTPAIKDNQSVYIPNLMIPPSRWGETDSKKDARKAYLEASQEIIDKYGLRPKTFYFDGSGDYEEIYPSVEELTAGQLRAAMQSTDDYYPNPAFSSDSQRVDEIAAAENPSDDGVLAETDGKKYVQKVSLLGVSMDGSYTFAKGQESAKIPLQNITVANTISASGKVTVTPAIGGTIHSTTPLAALSFRVWLEINGKKYGDRPVSMVKGADNTYSLSIEPYEIATEDVGSVALKGYIFVAPASGSLNPVLTYALNMGTTTLEVQVVPSENFKVELRQIGFDIAQQQSAISDGLCTIAFKTGWCAGREFTVKKCQYNAANDRWILTVARQNDESLSQYFPNSVYRIEPGDRFVLTDLTMPEIYITSAQERLYARAQEVLNALSTPKIIYEPEIDAKVLAASPEPIMEGMYMPIFDEDLIEEEGYKDWVLIDTVEIDEGAEAIPTYKITLQDEKRESALARLTKESGRNAHSITEITLRDLRTSVEELSPDYMTDEEVSVRVVASHPIIGYDRSFEEEPVNEVVLTCETTGIENPTYQWYFRGAIDWVAISGATSQTYTVDPNSSLYFLNGEIVEDFRCVCGGIGDEVQIMKVLSNALTLSLSNPAHIFEAGVQFAVEAEDRTDVIGYRGIERIPTNVKMSAVRFLDPSRVVIPVTYFGGNILDSDGKKLTDSLGKYLVTASGNSASIYNEHNDLMMTIEVVDNNTTGTYLKVTVTDKLDIPAGVIEIPVIVREADDDHTEKVVNLYYSWGLALQGNASFTSVVFKRSATQPATPTGGSFDTPVPEGWSDGVPPGDDTLWMSMRTFSANGLYPQDEAWSTPTGAFDTADVDFEWSTEETIPTRPNPGYDPSHDTTPPIWHNDSANAIWMAIRKKSGGVWGAWEVFRCKGEKGESPLFADLSNEADGLAVGSNGILDVQMVLQTKVALWYGNEAVTITNITPDVPSAFEGSIVPSYPNGKADGTINFTIAANTNFNNVNSVEIPIVISSAKGSRGVTFTIIPVAEGEDGMVYTLVPSADCVKGSYNASDNIVYTPTSVSCQRYTRSGNGALTASSYGVLKYSVDGGSTRQTYSSAVQVSSAVAAGRIIFYWYSDAQETTLIDRETVPIVTDGASPLFADLSNEADGLAVGSDGVLSASPSSLSTKVHIYSGNAAQSITAISADNTQIPSSFRNKFTISSSGLNTTEGTVSIAIAASPSSPIDFSGVESVRIPITITCGKGSRTVVYTLIIIKDGEDGAVFVLQPSADVIKGTRNADNTISYDQSGISCARMMRKGSGELSASTFGVLKMSVDGGSTKKTYAAITNTSSDWTALVAAGKIIYYWFDDAQESHLIDRETIPVVVDGAKGADGVSASTVYLYKRSSNGAPTVGPNVDLTYTFATGALSPKDSGADTYGGGWSKEIPSGDDPCYVTMAFIQDSAATKVIKAGYNNASTPGDWAPATRLTGDNGLMGKVMRGINPFSATYGAGVKTSTLVEYQGLTDTDTSHIYYDMVYQESGGTRVYYYCKVGGSAARSHAPGVSGSGWEDYWVVATNFDFIATRVLLASNAFIDILSGNALYMYDNGQEYVVAGVQGGSTTADGGQTVSQVNFFAGTHPETSAGAGDAVTPLNAPFRVTYEGVVYCKDIRITGGQIEISNGSAVVFSVSNTGALVAQNATITGGSIIVEGTADSEGGIDYSIITKTGGILGKRLTIRTQGAGGHVTRYVSASDNTQNPALEIYDTTGGSTPALRVVGASFLSALTTSADATIGGKLSLNASEDNKNGNEYIISSPTSKHFIDIEESDYDAMEQAGTLDPTATYFVYPDGYLS